jgi:hypothetical protein
VPAAEDFRIELRGGDVIAHSDSDLIVSEGDTPGVARGASVIGILRSGGLPEPRQ